jgi:hypothetical protein
MLVFVDVVAQKVRTTWTKRSRGGPPTAARNRVPAATGFELRFAVRPLGDPAARVEPPPMSRPRRREYGEPAHTVIERGDLR